MSAISALASSTDRAAPSAYESMSSDDFIRVMFAELTRQDPTKPTDSKDLLAQLGSIRGIES
ncbi:MAG: flagellar hook assembly protein FlgD, partial [Phycisphaerae bacterium]|nr:flagellar hook assembly protein FlgD [Phycisphaerae bacterium]